MRILVIVAQDFIELDRRGTWEIQIRHSQIIPQLLQNKTIGWVHNRNAVHWQSFISHTERKYGSIEDLYADIKAFEQGTHPGINRVGSCKEANKADVCLLVSQSESTLIWNALMAMLAHDGYKQKDILESIRTSGGIDVVWHEERAAA
jgi:hypothetical protein